MGSEKQIYDERGLCKVKKDSTELRKTCLERLLASEKRDNIAKAIVIEANQIYTYGYDRVHKA